MTADDDVAIDYNSLTEEEKVELSFRYLCRRLLDIDPECRGVKGCPFHFAAWPMIQSWLVDRSDELPEQVAQTVQRMRAAHGQGRSCEFGEIKCLAEKYLQATMASSSS